MSVTLKLTVLFAILVQAACGGHRLNEPAPVSLNLLPPAEISTAVLLKQKITLQADTQKQQQFLAIARFDFHQSKLVALSPSGQRLLSLEYDGDKLTQESTTQYELPGREILAIIQFATWPESSIRTHYPERDGWLIETAVNQRILLTASGPVLKISYQPEMLSVENYLQGYRVIVNTLERTRL